MLLRNCFCVGKLTDFIMTKELNSQEKISTSEQDDQILQRLIACHSIYHLVRFESEDAPQ